ncbi:MAG: tetratricopeptide repeat protein [Lachnospiraceae bacterium]
MKKFLFIIIASALLLGGCAEEEPTGTELLEQGSYEDAAEKFEAAIADGQNPEEAYRGLGIAYWEQGDYRRARASFSRALSYGAEETASIYQFMGVCDMQLGYLESALSWFEKGLVTADASDEMIQEMKFNQIAVYEQLGDLDRAKEKLAAYVADYPDDEQAGQELEFLETR